MTFWLLHSKSPSPPNEMLNARQNPVFYDIWHYLPYLVKTSIHRSMGSAPVGAQCPFASSLGECLGYRDWLWYPGLLPVLVSIALPFAFHISMFSIHSSSPAIGFHSSIFFFFFFLFFFIHFSSPAIGFHSSIFLRWVYLHPTSNPPFYSRLGTGTMVIGYLKRLRCHGGGFL